MKKLLYLFSLMIMGMGSLFGQTPDLYVQVYDNNGPAQGVAMFLYDVNVVGVPVTNADSEMFHTVVYTDANGVAAFTTQGNANLSVVGAMDCQGVFTSKVVNRTPAGMVSDTLNLSCSPNACQAMLTATADSSNTQLHISAFNHRAAAYAGISGTVNHACYVNGSYYAPTQATDDVVLYLIPVSSISGGPTYSIVYARDSLNCTGNYDTVTFNNGGSSLACQASFYIDTVNTNAFQGQLIVGENSTTSSGSIIHWSWDFGDGTVINQRYPTHTYASTAATYIVCLTITSTDNQDTCMSTFCDTIQFDSSGAAVFKNGFTINVVDPATFNVDENELQSVIMYPNPSAGDVRLTWEAGLDVENVDVININGALIQSIEPISNELELRGMSTGVYFIRVRTADAMIAKRLIVQ